MTSSVTYKELPEYSKLMVKWTLPSQMPLLSDPDAKGFQFKIQPSANNSRVTEIYFLYPSSTFLSISFMSTLYYYHNAFENINSYKCRVTKEIECFEADEPNKWHILASLSLSDSKIDEFQDGMLLFEFTILIYHKKMCENPVILESQLSLDLENMLLSGLYSDLVIKSVDGQELKVHRSMLASRCSVLKALFEHDSVESETNIVESPFDSVVLKEVFSFIYSDKANVKKNPQELLAAADYYQLMRLKNLCEDELSRKLSFENVIETLQLADLHSAEHLKESSLKFIKIHGLAKIMESDGWANLKCYLIYKSICEYLH